MGCIFDQELVARGSGRSYTALDGLALFFHASPDRSDVVIPFSGPLMPV